MEKIDSLYYTFSTISQVLAGFIALSGVFVLFKLQEYKKILLIQAQRIYCYLSGFGEYNSFNACPEIAVDLKKLRQAECIGGMQEEICKILDDSKLQNDYRFDSTKKMNDLFVHIDNKRISLINLTKISMIFGILTILFSLIVLSNADNICVENYTIFYILGFIGTIVSIITMTIGIFIAFTEKNFLKVQSPNR